MGNDKINFQNLSDVELDDIREHWGNADDRQQAVKEIGTRQKIKEQKNREEQKTIKILNILILIISLLILIVTILK